MDISDLSRAALAVLTTGNAIDKAHAARRAADAWRSHPAMPVGYTAPPERPQRPDRPELRAPADMPRRKAAGSQSARIALLHALAHIELNAIDLAFDMVARFSTLATENGNAGIALPRRFFDEWVSVGDDEARHFLALSDRLEQLGAAYGDLPAHDGLWQAAEETAHDLAARLAIVPMVLEARGLDVTPGMIAGLRKAGDDMSADILQMIHDEEINHVAIGKRWFGHIARQTGKSPRDYWQSLVTQYFRGPLKPPFNEPSRRRADNFTPDWYDPLIRVES